MLGKRSPDSIERYRLAKRAAAAAFAEAKARAWEFGEAMERGSLKDVLEDMAEAVLVRMM